MQCPIDPNLFIAVAVSGDQQEPGRPACVWVDASKCSARHRPLDEVQPPEVRQGLAKMHAEDGGVHFLIVSVDAGNAHAVLRQNYPKV